MRQFVQVLLLIFSGLLTSCGVDLPNEVAEAYDTLPHTLDYNIHVRPILSDRCWSCHGPDANTRMANLRLDNATSAFAKTDDHTIAIKPGNPGGSELVKRILSQDAEYQMPTPESNLSLTAKEKATLIKWIEDGAQYDPHWAFTPLPGVAKAEMLSGERIDALIQAGYEQHDLKPNQPASPRALIRRVYRDLTGLPPTYEQTKDYVDYPTEENYLKIVDGLLASDACAEHLTLEWLDVARYADSHGLHADGIRTSWPWRDWVIDAFRQNKPYDQFVTEQLAGDLLPDATEANILATAFNRNHPMTAEGGADMEEFRMQYVMDRTNTFSTAFLGLTLECAACHDHKFDPVSQAEYYQVSAFFNSVKEFGMTGDDGDYGPVMMLASDETKAKLNALDSRIAELSNLTPAATAEQIEFINGLAKGIRPIAYLPLDRVKGKKTDGYPKSNLLDTLFTVAGRNGQAYYFDTEYDAIDIPIEPFEAYDPMSFSVHVNTVKRTEGMWQTFISNAGDKNAYWRGLDFSLDPENRLNFRLIHSLPGNYIEVSSVDSIQIHSWTQVGFTYDGSTDAGGVALYIDGKPVSTETKFNKLYKTVYPLTNDSHHTPTNRPYRLAVSGRHYTGEAGILKGALDDVKLYDKRLSYVEMAEASGLSPKPDPSWAQNHQAVIDQRKVANKLRALRKQRIETANEALDVMVMEDMPEVRPAHRLDRGSFETPAEVVGFGTPESVLGFDESRYEKNRLGLANWLFAEENPLSARVTANRYWQFIMGKGIVATAHDFGMQGKLPTHPELLDYLANGLRKADWDVKALLKAIVMSDTYKLSAAHNEENQEKDAANDYYACASSYRYSAESIRDYALATSGLLVKTVGGPSVRPYQPPGLWIEKSSFSPALYTYEEQSGDSLYRRSMYTFIRRTSPPPAMTTLDQPSRDRCTVTRERTNTPLQALVLLNDPQFVEAARVLAQACIGKGPDVPTRPIQQIYKRVLGRDASPNEYKPLEELYYESRSSFAERPKEAKKLLAVGEHPLPTHSFRIDQLAALTLVASTGLNHDEIYTRR